MSILYRLFFARRWWLLLLPVVVCLGLAAIDSRFAYVALIVAMAMVMISLPILYYYARVAMVDSREDRNNNQRRAATRLLKREDAAARHPVERHRLYYSTEQLSCAAV